MNTFIRARRQGNSLVITIPEPMRRALGLVTGDHLLVTAEENVLSLRKVEPANLVREIAGNAETERSR